MVDLAERRVPPRISESAYEAKMAGRRQTLGGLEIPDPKPMAPPIGFFRQPSMVEHMRAMVKGELLRQAAEAAGAETFEEADDFEVDDELVPLSGFENDKEFEPPIPAAEAGSAPKEARDGVPLPPSGGKGEGAKGGEPQGESSSQVKSEASTGELPLKPKDKP